MKPEDKSDALDAKIIAVSAKDYGRQKIRTTMIAATLVFVVVGFISTFLVLKQITQNTNYVVTSQIPGLKAQIKSRDQTISDQQDELNQAISYILKYADQLKNLGIDPGKVVIQPPKH